MGKVDLVAKVLIGQGHYYGTEEEQLEAALKNAREILGALALELAKQES